MEIYESRLPRKAYLAALKNSVGFHIPFWGDCANGIIIGSFFSIAYYSPYEWNRRITRECNRAFGIVTDKNGKTEVRFIRSKGLLSPSWMIFVTLACWFYFYLNGFGAEATGILFSAGIALVLGLITAFESSVTDEGVTGEGEITRILKAPEDYYG